MVVVKINRRLLLISAVIILVSLLGLSFHVFSTNREISAGSGEIIGKSGKAGSLSMAAYLKSTDDTAHSEKGIELFDISQGKVIRKAQSNPEIQGLIEEYFEGITGMYVKVKAFPDKGYIIRVPLEPPVMVQSKWLKDYGINSVDEIFILFPEQGEPYLLVLDEKQRPLFFNFEGNTDILLEKLNFKFQEVN